MAEFAVIMDKRYRILLDILAKAIHTTTEDMLALGLVADLKENRDLIMQQQQQKVMAYLQSTQKRKEGIIQLKKTKAGEVKPDQQEHDRKAGDTSSYQSLDEELRVLNATEEKMRRELEETEKVLKQISKL